MKTQFLPLLLLITVTINANLFAQSDYSDFDRKMISLAEEVANRIQSKNKIKVALGDFTDSFKEKNTLGDYIADDFSIHFTNASDNLEVTDRHNLKQLMKEHKLNAEGYIDPSTAKRIGMLIAADAIVTGTVDIGLHSLRIRIKIIDTETGLHFAAALRNLPIDENIKVILKDAGFESSVKPEGKRINTNEESNNKRTTNKKCESLKTGDYYFENKSQYSYLIDIKSSINSYKKTITVSKGQTTALQDLPSGTYTFKMYKNNLRTTAGPTQQGSFRLKSCQSITYSILKSKEYDITDDFYKAVKKKRN